MTFCVYLIISKNINTNKIVSYVGYTKNIKKRILLHNSSRGAKFTRGRQWIIIYKRFFNDKSKAMQNEYKLKKNFKKRNKIKINYLSKIKNIK